jgi:hypothetical protein
MACVVQTLKSTGKPTWFRSRCFLEESTTIAELQDPLDPWCRHLPHTRVSPIQFTLSRYPAGHVRLHKLLYEVTDGGKDMRLAQYIYGLLYLATLTLSCAIYNAAGGVPNWIVLLLPLSKRLHSIYVLRLFNDCWAVVAVQCAILLFQYGLYDTGMLFFRCGLLHCFRPRSSDFY